MAFTNLPALASMMFNRPYPIWLQLAFALGIALYATYMGYAAVFACKSELSRAKETKWYENYGFLADLKTPKVG